MRLAFCSILVTIPRPLFGKSHPLKVSCSRSTVVWEAQLGGQHTRGFKLFQEDLLRLRQFFKDGWKKPDTRGAPGELRSKVGRDALRRMRQIGGAVERRWEGVEVRLDNLRATCLLLVGEFGGRLNRALGVGGNGSWSLLKSFQWQSSRKAYTGFLLPRKDPERKNLRRIVKGNTEDALVVAAEALWKSARLMMKTIVVSTGFVFKQVRAAYKSSTSLEGWYGRRKLSHQPNLIQAGKKHGFTPVRRPRPKLCDAKVVTPFPSSLLPKAKTQSPRREKKVSLGLLAQFTPFKGSLQVAASTATAGIAALISPLIMSFGSSSFDTLLALSAMFGTVYASARAKRRLSLTNLPIDGTYKSDSARKVEQAIKAVEKMRKQRISITPVKLSRGLRLHETKMTSVESNYAVAANPVPDVSRLPETEAARENIVSIDATVSAIGNVEPGVYSLPIVGGLLNLFDYFAFKVESLVDRISRRIIVGLSLTSYDAASGWEIQRSLRARVDLMKNAREWNE